MNKIYKTPEQCATDLKAILHQKKVEVKLLKRHYADFNEVRKLTRLQDALTRSTRSMDDVRRSMLDGR